jgi:pimeloyl-ACP methyl ester carboxylesterase
MTTAMNILIVHGIGWGESGKDYAGPLERNLRREFDKAIRRLKLDGVSRREARGSRALRIEAANWSPVTQRPQNALIKLIYSGWNPLRSLNLRYFYRRQMVSMVGDVIAYEGGADNRVYQAIHAAVDGSVAQLSRDSQGERTDSGYAPLTVIGHSLGSVIASDYIWDHARGGDQPHHLAGHGLALVNFVTMGSPIAVYALRNNAGGGPNSIRDALDSPIQVEPESGLWLNFYDRDDPIAFPLRKIRSYAETGVIDHRVNAGSLITAWNPLSHVGYWDCREVAQLLGRKLALDWARANSPSFAERRYEQDLADLRADLGKT